MPRSLPAYAGCTANTLVTTYTAFTEAQCKGFAALYNKLAAETPLPPPLLCTSESCNTVIPPATTDPHTKAGCAKCMKKSCKKECTA